MAILAGSLKETLAASYAGAAVKAALYTADPGTSATTSKVTGAGYADQTIVWAAGTAGDGIYTGTATFTVPASVSVAYGGLLDSAGTTLLDKVAVVYNSQPSSGSLTVTFTYTQS